MTDEQFDAAAFWKREHDHKVAALGRSLQRELVLKNELMAIIEEIAAMRAETADDGEPLTPDWLVETGGKRYAHEKIISINHVGFADGEREVDIGDSGEAWYGGDDECDGTLLTTIKTRGEFRALVRGIKLPVKGIQ